MSSDLRSASSPTKPGDVTSEWWAGVLAQRGITQGVAGVGCEPVGHGMLCDTFRFEVTYDEPRSPDVPDSFIVKFAAVDPGSRTTGFKSLMYEREAGFYRDIAHTLEVRAPRSYHVSIDTGTQTMAIVMEDLAPARPGDQLAGCGADEAALAMEQAAALHGPRWGDDTLANLGWLNIRERNYSGYAHMTRTKHEGFRERFADRLSSEVLDVCDHLALNVDAYFGGHRGPWTIQHADFRLDNMLFDAAGGTAPLAVVDWQTILYGPGPCDVAYFLGAAMEPEERRRHELDLVRLYHGALLAQGVTDYDWDRCWRDYRLYSYSGLLNTIGPAMVLRQTERGDQMLTTLARRHATHALDMNAAELLAT
ncbi:MAG: hypothetical protein QOC74_1643 [Pseudonocardiales bacterium]|nr:hypothetical protein [Pseudonocardiales bacterium]